MNRFFSSWFRSLASLFSGVVLAVTCFGAVNAGAMIVISANSDVRPTSNTFAVNELLVDWNQDSIIYLDQSTENAARPALPSLSPDEPRTSDAMVSSDEAVRNDTTPNSEAKAAVSENASSDTTESTASDANNSTNDNYSDYYKFKFGRFGGYYGENADASSPAGKSDSDTATNDTASKDNNENQSGESNADSGKPTDNGTVNSPVPAADPNSSHASKIESESKSGATDKTSDDTNYSQPENFNQDYIKYKYRHSGDYSGENADANPNSPQSTDSSTTTVEASKAEETTKTAESAKTDESPKSDMSSSDAASADSKPETSSSSDSTSPWSIQDYYHYRYELIEDQYGDNQNAAPKENVVPSNSDLGKIQGSDDSTMNAEDSGDETASDGDQSASSPMADAMLAVASRCADDIASSYGLKMSQIMALLGQMR
ncbi:MAG: hypothetical protein ACLP9L_23190 [Thermoguttaceae bacterium]